MSRIHRKKGLLNLVRAWAHANIDSAWRLVLAGPDENGHQQAVQDEIDRMGLQQHISFVGAVDDQSKWQLLADSDLFVLPSFNENFGIVVAEAMAAGLPVITTTGTPWQVLAERRFGWWVEPTVEELTAALNAACGLTRTARCDMGRRASQFVRAEFNWDQVARDMLRFYDWLIGKAATPEYVQGDADHTSSVKR